MPIATAMGIAKIVSRSAAASSGRALQASPERPPGFMLVISLHSGQEVRRRAKEPNWRRERARPSALFGINPADRWRGGRVPLPLLPLPRRLVVALVLETGGPVLLLHQVPRMV